MWYNDRAISFQLQAVEKRASIVKHISVDNQPEDVKHFLLSLNLDSDRSILELDGKQLLCVSPVADIASIQRGIDQMEAGEGRPIADVDSEIREKFGFPQRQ